MKNRIKELRKELGLNQTDFAAKIGVSRSAMAKLESGENAPSLQTIMLICKELHVNQQWLMEGTGNMFLKLSEREELASWVAEINRMPTTSAQRRVANMLTMLGPEDWVTIDKMIRILKEGE